VRPGVDLLPAEAELAPIFKVCILKADFGEGIAVQALAFARFGEPVRRGPIRP